MKKTWILILLLLILPLLPMGADGEAAGHVHRWNKGTVRRAGETDASILYTCRDCKMKAEIPFPMSAGKEGYAVLSTHDGAGGGTAAELEAVFEMDPAPEELSLQWYACADAEGNGAEELEGETFPTLAVPAFSEPGIRYYFCEAEAVFPLDSQSASHRIRSQIYAAAYTGLPTVYIDVAQGEDIVQKEYFLDASFRLDPGPASGGTVTDAVRVKGRGNASWVYYEKKGYTVRFEEKTDLLGMGKAKKWALIANHPDKSLLRNWFSSLLAREVFPGNDWTPRYEYVDLVLNGEYRGSYLLATPISITKSRVNIQDIEKIREDQNRDGALTWADGGFIIEVDGRQDALYSRESEHGVFFSLADPSFDEGSPMDLPDYIYDAVQGLENRLYADDPAEIARTCEEELDAESFVNWYLINELAKNNDAQFFASVFLYYDPAGGKMHMGPIWDFDISCGNIGVKDSAECADPEGFFISDSAWISQLFRAPAFRERVAAAWKENREKLDRAINTEIRRKADEIAFSAQLNFVRWPILGKYVWPGTEGYKDRTTWQSEIDFLTDWLNRRAGWMDGALAEMAGKLANE